MANGGMKFAPMSMCTFCSAQGRSKPTSKVCTFAKVGSDCFQVKLTWNPVCNVIAIRVVCLHLLFLSRLVPPPVITMMRFLNLLLASVLSGSALADLTFDIMAVSQGKEIDWKAAGLEIVPIPQRSRFHHHEGNSTAAAGQHPHQKRASTSGNWCGISQKVQSNRDTLSSVYGYFQAPNLSFRPGYPYPQWASAWIGMDGGTCNSALLQSGVTVVLNSNGQQSASAWFEWAPRASYSISGFPVHVGDWLFVNITATSATSGIVNIANLAQSLAMTININDGPTLCRQDADWIVEDFYDAKGQVAFGRFQDVWFEDVGATTTKGQKIDLKNASPISLSNGTAISCVANVFDDNNFWCASQG